MKHEKDLGRRRMSHDSENISDFLFYEEFMIKGYEIRGSICAIYAKKKVFNLNFGRKVGIERF